MPKTLLRQSLLRQRRQLPVMASESRGRRAQQRLLQLPLFTQAHSVALYSPIRNEVPTQLLFLACRRRGKRVFYPRVEGATLQLVEVTSMAELSQGAFGVLEPTAPTGVALRQIELLVIPGVAFDRRGHRLGYGKGYYDRLLHEDGFQGVRVGLCFDFQVVDELPVQPHDVPMDWIVTERDAFAVQRG